MKKYLFTTIILIFCTTFYFLNNEETLNDEIVFGQSAALSGPSGKLGQKIKQGAEAYFSYINDKGGINGRKIRLETLDDYYEPKYTQKNTIELIQNRNVFAIFGNLGTPTSKVALEISKQYNIPYLVPFTGASFLRSPSQSSVINLRNSYYAETEALVKFLVNTYNYKKIAVFYQNDSYGKAGYDGVIHAMNKLGLKIIAEGRYRRNTLSYRNALHQIKQSKPEAIIMIGAYKTASSFIKSARKEGLTNTKFCNISFVGSKDLVNALNEETQNVLISQVVPIPWDKSNIAIEEYQKIYSSYFPNEDFDFISLEGFLAAKLVVSALKETGKELTKSKFMKTFENLKPNTLEGLKISLSSTDRQALEDIYITDYYQGKFRLLEKVNIK